MTIFRMLCLLVCLLGVSCRDSREPPKPTAASNAGPSAAEVRREFREAGHAASAYLSENKDEAVAVAERRLKELDKEINRLGERTKTLTDNARSEADRTLAELKKERERLAERLEPIRQSSKEAWQEMKAGFSEAMQALEESWNRARAKYDKD